MRIKSGIAAGALALVLALGGVTSATAALGDGVCDTGEFCGYALNNYGTILVESRAAKGTNKVEIANDRMSSYKNRTANCWQGITARSGLPDQIVLRANAYTSQSTPDSGWNDKIDHFRVVANSTC